jgi:uncharacterized protein with NRDE domain
MCLLVAAHDVHPAYSLVLVGHRDEFHARPTAPLHWWPDAPDLLAGRDLEAGGTWLGLHRDGRLAVLTNFRGEGAQRPGSPSRGLLIPEFLVGTEPAAAFARRLADTSAGYSGFNMLVFDGTALAYAANRPESAARQLPAGLYGLSNHLLDTPWPKVLRTRERVRAALGAGGEPSRALFAALQDREPASDADLPSTGLDRDTERLVSAPFIVDPVYGTRCATVVLVGRDGLVRVEERRYAPDGETIGRTAIAFHTTRTATLAG